MRSLVFSLAAPAGLALLLGCSEATTPAGDAAGAETKEPAAVASGKEGLLYRMGLALADGARPLQFSKEEIEYLIAGADDQLSRRELAAKPEEFGPKAQALIEARRAAAQTREETAAKEFVDKAAKESGASVTPSGLVYREDKAGAGAKPGAESEVTVHYTGTLRDGKVFDSSVERGQPATFALNQVIPCWTEALQKMSAGGKSTIWCPSAIAYGPAGAGNLIPPGAALRFEVELLEVKASVAPPPAAEDPQETSKPQEPKS